MPFQTRGEGKNTEVYWVSPSAEEVTKNQAIFEPEGNVVTISEALEKQLSSILDVGRNVAVEAEELMAMGEVDVVIPVHNGLHVLKKCIHSVLLHTNYPFNLIIVDDGSDAATKEWLKHEQGSWVTEHLKRIDIATNKKNRGFAATCNRGSDRGDAPYIVFLNSDVIVTQGWLTKLVKAAEADPRNAIVNPATNNTALVNIPLKEGMSYIQMNQMFERRPPTYPEIMPTGFCFFVKRNIFMDLGGLDEGFTSYGEESDFWMRALKGVDPDTGEFGQYRSVMADDSYVFHERGSSFSVNDPDEWMGMRKKGSSRFHKLHPDFRQLWSMAKETDERLSSLKTAEIAGFRESMKKDSTYNIAWLVHASGYCGGMKFIADIVNELQDRGVNAQVVHIKRDPSQELPSPLSELRSAPIYFDTKDDCVNNFATRVFDKGIVVSATGELSDVALALARENPDLEALNHLQSWDIGQTSNVETQDILKTLYKGFTKTITNAEWLTNELADMGVPGDLRTVHPGVETDLFYPRERDVDDRPTAMLVLNSMYPFKGAQRGAQVAIELDKLSKERGKAIRLIGLGVNKIQGIQKIMCIPTMPPTRLAKMLGEEVDVLFDPSFLHTYGLPCAEALCSGVKIASYANKGIYEYADKTLDVVLPDTTTPAEMAKAIWDQLFDTGTHSRALNIPTRDDQVDEFIDTLGSMFNLSEENKTEVCFITPHMRKFGGPTTIVTTANGLAERGYNVSICSVYDDSINLELTKMAKVPLYFGLQHMPKCDVVIVPSDSDQHHVIESMGRYERRILLKLGHNERFKALEEMGLQHDYDAVFASSQLMKDVCETTTKGWKYPARKAQRIGWYNYEFSRFDTSPEVREYNKLDTTPVTICGLVHNHPLKGTKDFMDFANTMRLKYGDRVRFIAIGEAPAHNHLTWLKYFLKPSRDALTKIAQQTDIFVSFSHTEGLGRLPLEFMSAGAVVVASDTGCEFLKKDMNSLLFPIKDVLGAQKQVTKLMEDLELFSKLAIAGYATAKLYGDSTTYIDNFVAKLEEVLDANV